MMLIPAALAASTSAGVSPITQTFADCPSRSRAHDTPCLNISARDSRGQANDPNEKDCIIPAFLSFAQPIGSRFPEATGTSLPRAAKYDIRSQMEGQSSGRV